MDNKLYDQFHVVLALIDTNKQETDELKQYADVIKKKLNKHHSEFIEIKALLNKVIGHNQTSSSENMDSPKAQDPAAMFLYNKKYTPL